MPENGKHFESVDGPVHIEHLASVGNRVRRKKESNQQEKEKRRRKAGIEETLQDEQEEWKQNRSEENGHIDFHA